MGWWIIFPIIFMVFMMLMMFRMISRGGPMGMMGGMGGGHGHGSDAEHRDSGAMAGGDTTSQQSPLEIAERRYASGELTREQFMELTADLQAAGGGARGEERDT